MTPLCAAGLLCVLRVQGKLDRAVKRRDAAQEELNAMNTKQGALGSELAREEADADVLAKHAAQVLLSSPEHCLEVQLVKRGLPHAAE